MHLTALSVALSFTALGAAGCSSPILDAVVPAGERRPFTVRGTKILDPAGREFVIKGVAVNGPNWVWRRDVSRDADYIARTWGFNLVRALSRVADPASPGADATNSPEALVDAFTSRGVVVLFSPRVSGDDPSTGAGSPRALEALVAWQRTLATRYKGNPYVWFEVQGAPGGCDLSPAWLEVHRRVVSAIRDEAGAPNVIVANGQTWGADDGCLGAGDVADPARSAVLTYGEALRSFGGRRYEDLVFAFSILWPKSRARLTSYLDEAAARGLPVLVADYGGKFYEGRNIESGVDALFAVAVPRKIGRVVYGWYDGHGGADFSNALTTAGNGTTGAAIDDGTSPTNLSWLGRLAWDDTHRTDGL